MELPASWGLTTERNQRGTLDVIGKDDSGKPYRVRTTDRSEITELDVSEIAAVDRERTTAKEFIGNLLASGERATRDRDDIFESELVEAAGPVVHAGFERRGSTLGYSRRYAANFDKTFGGN